MTNSKLIGLIDDYNDQLKINRFPDLIQLVFNIGNIKYISAFKLHLRHVNSMK